jgi:hypothetical protein
MVQRVVQYYEPNLLILLDESLYLGFYSKPCFVRRGMTDGLWSSNFSVGILI